MNAFNAASLVDQGGMAVFFGADPGRDRSGAVGRVNWNLWLQRATAIRRYCVPTPEVRAPQRARTAWVATEIAIVGPVRIVAGHRLMRHLLATVPLVAWWR